MVWGPFQCCYYKWHICLMVLRAFCFAGLLKRVECSSVISSKLFWVANFDSMQCKSFWCNHSDSNFALFQLVLLDLSSFWFEILIFGDFYLIVSSSFFWFIRWPLAWIYLNFLNEWSLWRLILLNISVLLTQKKNQCLDFSEFFNQHLIKKFIIIKTKL